MVHKCSGLDFSAGRVRKVLVVVVVVTHVTCVVRKLRCDAHQPQHSPQPAVALTEHAMPMGVGGGGDQEAEGGACEHRCVPHMMVSSV